MFAGALLLSISSSIVPEREKSCVKNSPNSCLEEDLLLVREHVPLGEEVADSIHQQEHLFLSLGAVASVQMMLQGHRSLHRADDVNMPLLYTTRSKTNDRAERENIGQCMFT